MENNRIMQWNDMGIVASSSDLKTVKMARVGPHLQQLAQNAELSQSVGQGKTGLQVCLKIITSC